MSTHLNLLTTTLLSRLDLHLLRLGRALQSILVIIAVLDVLLALALAATLLASSLLAATLGRRLGRGAVTVDNRADLCSALRLDLRPLLSVAVRVSMLQLRMYEMALSHRMAFAL